MDAGGLTRQLAAADAVIQLVRENAPTEGIRGDTAAGVTNGTYLKAFRRYLEPIAAVVLEAALTARAPLLG